MMFITLDPVQYEEHYNRTNSIPRWAGTWPPGTVVTCERLNNSLAFHIRSVDDPRQGRRGMSRARLRLASPLDLLARAAE